MNLRGIQIGDYIEFALHKPTLHDPTVYVYGEVKKIDKFGVLDVELSEPHDGKDEMRIPDYLARKISEYEYKANKKQTRVQMGTHAYVKGNSTVVGSSALPFVSGALSGCWGEPPSVTIDTTNTTIVTTCIHKWEKTGVSPLTGEVWENCRHCGIKGEDV